MRNKQASQFSHVDGMQGESEQRSEPYIKYGERAAQISTQQSATSDSGASGSARGPAGMVRGL